MVGGWERGIVVSLEKTRTSHIGGLDRNRLQMVIN